jgi:hypothetical protein
MSSYATYYHLFGDLYWKQTPLVYLPLALVVVTGLVSLETWVEWFPGVFRSLYASSPDAWAMLRDNYIALPWVGVGAVLGLSVRFGDGDGEE